MLPDSPDWLPVATDSSSRIHLILILLSCIPHFSFAKSILFLHSLCSGDAPWDGEAQGDVRPWAADR